MILFSPVENPLTNQWEVTVTDPGDKETVHSFGLEQLAKDFIATELIDFAESGLTVSQRQFIIGNWDKLSLEKLVEQTFKIPGLDGRSKQGRAVKKYLSSKNFAVQPAYMNRVPDVELSDAQKDFIKNNLTKGLSSLELAREVFGDPYLVQLTKKHRIVDAFIKTLDPALLAGKNIPLLVTSAYEPPKTAEGTIKRLNKYLNVELVKDKLTPIQKKGVEYLTNHLSSPRFIRTINSYTDVQDRDSFESEFSRLIWDKPDLTPEEVGLYINLCADYIMMFKIQAQIELLDQRLKQRLNDSDADVSIRLTESISKKTKEYDECFNRHHKLINDLTGKRSDRMKKNVQDNGSVLMLIQAWKNEEERVRFILMAKAKEAEIEDEIKRLETMNEMKARILGIGVNEAIYGT